MTLLEIKNLHAKSLGENEKQILKGVNLKIDIDKTYALMGPNGSGKSTLASVIMGHPGYEITEGEILFDGENLAEMSPDERAKKGVFLSFQYPKEISGVTISNFLRAAYNNLKEKKLSLLEFKNLLEKNAEKLGVGKEFLSRYLNAGFSGGEKKRAEILQMLTLDPKFAVLDETDSGLDIDALRIVADGVNQFKSFQGKSVLIITHYKRILEYINPDRVFIMVDGKIVLEGDKEIVDHLEEKGYGWVKEEMEREEKEANQINNKNETSNI